MAIKSRFWGLGALLAALAASATAAANPAVDEAFQLVYQIKTAAFATAPKASYGSGFVVREDGLLATNFHVVATALHEPEKYKIYLVDGDQAEEAEVVNTNVVNDLALVRVKRRFPRALKLAAREPRIGERIWSLGLPEDLNKSMIEGNYNGVLREGPYAKIQMSLPLNSGMSGGPTVDANGELVGVNVSVLLFAQSLAFAVPARYVTALVEAGERRYSKKDGVNSLDADIERQLVQVQDELMAQIRAVKDERLALPGYSAMRLPGFLKCWRTSEDGAKQRWAETAEQCFLGNAAMVEGDTYAGTLRVTHRVVESKRLNPWQLYNRVRIEGTGEVGHDPGSSTRLDCKSEDVVNANGLPLRVAYCLNTFVRMKGIYDVDFSIVSMDSKKRVLIVTGLFSGFTAASIEELMRLTIDGLRSEDA